MVSSVTQPGLEEAAAAATGPKIFQLYVRGDNAWVDDVVKRAVDAGYDAFAITVDTAAYSRRERDIAGRFVKPWRAAATGQNYQAGFTWDNVRHFKDKHSIPLILKGIATGEDAALCCEYGVDGVYVSNHGGRQLDHGRGSMDVLPEVMAAVRGRAKVIVDGSICRGTDIVKAIALGADAVAMGRMYCYALAADGDAGVHKMLELMEHEFGVAMALAGARSLNELHPGYRVPRRPAGHATACPQRLSAFAGDARLSRGKLRGVRKSKIGSQTRDASGGRPRGPMQRCYGMFVKLRFDYHPRGSMARNPARPTPRNPLSVDPEREHRVRERAYLMWESDGRPHGRDVEYWERARELVGMEESAGSGLLPNPQNTPESPRETGIEEAELQENLGEFPDRLADQGEVKTTPAPKRKTRAKPKKPG